MLIQLHPGPLGPAKSTHFSIVMWEELTMREIGRFFLNFLEFFFTLSVESCSLAVNNLPMHVNTKIWNDWKKWSWCEPPYFGSAASAYCVNFTLVCLYAGVAWFCVNKQSLILWFSVIQILAYHLFETFEIFILVFNLTILVNGAFSKIQQSSWTQKKIQFVTENTERRNVTTNI